MAMASPGPILHKAKTRSKQSIHLPSSRVLSTVLASGGAFRGRAGALAMLSARWWRRPAPRRLSARPLHDGRRACCWPSAGPRAGDAIKLAIAVGLRPMAWRGSPDALIRALLATLLMAPAASAHAWYTRACCAETDCTPVERVEHLANGALRLTSRVGTTVVPAAFPRQASPDQHMHICMVCYSHLDDMRPLCFFVPPTAPPSLVAAGASRRRGAVGAGPRRTVRAQRKVAGNPLLRRNLGERRLILAAAALRPCTARAKAAAA